MTPTATATVPINPPVCPLPAVAAPASFPPDTVWFDDAPPTGAVVYGNWIWDPAQKASGTVSHTGPVSAGPYQHFFDGASALHVAAGHKLVVYALLDPCNPPREILFQWYAAGSWNHRAFWGEDLIGYGAPGGANLYPMGSLPAAGQWTRLEVPVSAVELEGLDLTAMAFTMYDGRTWFDRVGALSLVPPTTGMITGTVVNASGGSAVSGAAVTVTGTGTTATTNASGAFSVSVAAGTYTLTVTKSGFNNLTTGSIPVTNGQTTAVGTLSLTAAVGTLSGVVLSLPSGAVLPGAIVTVNQTGAIATTNVAGAFAFALPAGSYTVTASLGGYQPATTPLLTVTTGQRTTAAPLYLARPTGTFTGLVVTGSNPIAGAVVTATPGGISATTLADGTFQLAAPTYVTYDLVVTRIGFANKNLPLVHVYPGQTTNLGTVSLVSGGTITGVVRDSLTSAPVAGARVEWNGCGTPTPTVTNATGRFTFGVTPTTARLCVTAAGFAGTWTPYFIVTAGQTTTTPDISIVPTDGFVTGHVVLSVGGSPVLGATAFVTGGNYASTTTDANGFFSLALLAGTTNVKIKKTGYADITSAPVVVTTGKTSDIGTFGLDQSGVVTGTVINASTGAGIGAATLTVTGTSATAMSAADGSFALMAPPGTQTLTATKVGFAPLTTPPINVIAGDSLSAGVLALTPGGTIIGTVKNALTQAGLYGVNVTITGTGNTVTTNSSGQFSLMQVPGLWTLTFSMTGYVSTATLPLGVTAGGSSDLGTTYLVPQATLTGTVLDYRGSHVDGAKVLVKGSKAGGWTDSSGFFTFPATAGTLTLVINNNPCHNNSRNCLDYESASFTVAPGETRNLGSITLAEAAQIAGPVFPQSGSVPLGGAVVTATSSSRTFSGPLPLNVPPDTYNLVVSLDGWLSQNAGTHPIQYEWDFSYVANQIHLTRSSSLVGTVVNAAGGAPVPGATVTAGSVSAVTDAFGNFLLSVAAGSYPITIAKPGWNATTTAAQIVVTGDEKNAGVINLSAQAIGTITGTVVDAAGGSPVAGAAVSVVGGSASATTDASGTFTLVESPGSYPLLVTRLGWAALTTTAVTVTSGVSSPAPAIHLSAAAGTVTGIVVDVTGSAGISGAVITVLGTALATTTDGTGAFAISLAPGSYVLSASKAGWYSPVTAGVTVTNSGSTNAGSLWMSRDATFLGRVVNSFGGAGVFGVTVASDGPPAVTDANGAFRLSVHSTNALGIPATSTGLSLTRLNWPTLNTGPLYPLAPGGTTDVGTLTMTGSGLIVGRIATPSPYFGSLTVTVTGTGNHTSTTGQFFLWNPPGDNLTLTIQGGGVVDLVTPPFSVRSGQVTDAGYLGLHLLTPVNGHVLDSVYGTPIVGATVTLDSQGLSTTTGSDGGYAFVVIPGLVTFVVSKTGYATQSFPRQVDDSYLGGPLPIDLYLIPPNGPALQTFSVTHSIVGGTSYPDLFLTVKLTKPAPPIGATVQITSSSPGVVNFLFGGLFLSPGQSDMSINGGLSMGTNTAVTVETPVTLTATYGGVTLTAILLVEPPPASIIGVAPGWVLPGDTTPVIYGWGIQPGSTVTFTGPVYSLTDFQNPLCTVGGTCPASALAATVGVGGAYAAFAIPVGASPGIYHLKVRSAAGIDSTTNTWLAVDSTQRTRATVAPDQHHIAQRIYPGQTVTGTLSGTNPLNTLSDYNYYYFVATAGSHVNVSMQRVDRSLPWDNPSSLDPTLEIIAPDGFIYKNLTSEDNWPGVDRDASIKNAILPKTGLYFIVAEAMRGSGDYRLSFNFSSLAPPPLGARAVPMIGNFNTVVLNAGVAMKTSALMLDPRGSPMGGAAYSFNVLSSPSDTGAVQFIGGNSGTTSLDGFASANVKFTSKGRVRFKPSLDQPVFQQSMATELQSAAVMPGAAGQGESSDAGTDDVAAVPRYVPVGRRPVRIMAIRNGDVALAPGDLVRLPEEAVPGTRLERDGPSRRLNTEKAGASPGSTESNRAERFRRRVLGTTTGASARTPLGARAPLVITSCDADLDTFFEEGIDGASVSPSFTMTLTDKTPSTGQTTPNGVVDADGIHGHRIEKVIRLRIDIKDATGQTPAYPVLVRFGVGGPRPGRLILDPDGNRSECDTGSFIWHERDAQGSIIAPNEEVEYRLGTYAPFLGAIPDAHGPSGLKPLWGIGEGLLFEIGTVDASGGETFDTTSTFLFDVQPESGKPDHFFCIEASGSSCPDLLAYWSDFYKVASGTKANGDPRFANSGIVLYNSYFLHDRYDNVNFGYTSTSTTQPQPNIVVEFKDQTPSIFDASTDSTDFAGYSTWVHWNDDPSMPLGRYTATLRVTFPTDPEWPGGTVTKNVDLQFDRGTYHALVPVPSYEARFGVDDGGTPFRMAPGATTAGMPKTSTGDVQRLVLLGVTGSQVIGGWPLRVEPYEDPHTIWKQNPDGPGWVVDRLESPQDPRLETSDAPRFRLSLRDEDGKVVKEGAFRVHRCPRFDHEGPPQQSGPSGQAGRPCDTIVVPPLDSSEGVVDPVTLNPSASSNNRGYLGIELLKAPTKPGFYFIHAEPSSGDTPRYRIPVVNPQGDHPEVAYSGGNLLCLVENDIDPLAICCTCRDGQVEKSECKGSPTYVATGTYESHATDLELPTVGLPLSVSRQYFSSRRQSGFNGVGWSSSLEAHLSYAATSFGDVLDVLMPTGVVFRFTFSNPNGPFTPPQGRKDTLVKNSDKSFDLTLQQSRVVYHFDEKGLLTAMTDEYGSSVTIGYDASGKPTQIADAAGSGRFVSVSYRGDGKIDRLQDSAGRLVQYGYGPDGTLTSVSDPAGRLTHLTYSQGSFGPLLTQISDNWNRALNVITYDVADRTKSYSENFETYSYAYIDSTHTHKTDSSGNTTTFTFGVTTGLIAVHTPPSAEGSAPNHKDFDSDGRVTRAVDETGVATSFTYDAKGHVTSVTRDSQGSLAFRYDYTYDPSLVDRVTAVTPRNPSAGGLDPNWQGWRYDYFPLGSSTPGALRNVSRVKDDGATAETLFTFTYDSRGRIVQQTTAGGAQTVYAYDGQGNLSTVTAPSNSDGGARPQTTYGSYDGVGRPHSVTDPLGKVTTYSYDALGRVQTVTLPAANGNTFITSYSYDNFDPATQLVFTHITDPNGKVTKLGYDEHGRLLKSIDAASNTTTYTYTNNLLTAITDANNNVTGYHYDLLKRLDKTTFPDGSIERYTYYADGLLQTKTDRKGQMIGYQYDAFKRLKKKTYPDSTSITYTYQGQKLTSVVDTSVTPNESHTFGYDSSYRVSSNTQATRGTLGYTYTPDDRVATTAITAGPTNTYSYYPDGSLNTVTWSPVSGNFKYTYNLNGQYQTVTFPNGQHRNYNYDDQGRLLQIANIGPASQNLATYAYGYDVDNGGTSSMLGQRTSMTATVPSQGFTSALTKYSYDPLYQLTKAEYPAAAPFNSEIHQWTYDAIGNRLTNQVNAATQTYGYVKIGANPLNGQELSSDGVNTYTYDLNGSQTSRLGPANYGFVYDADNRLSSINGYETANYTYDYQGRRTSKTVGTITTKYLYDGLNLITETTGVTTTSYLFGPGIDEPLAAYRAGTLSYIAVDGLGSTVGESNPAGTVLHSNIFDVWGVTKTETGTRLSAFGYTSREFGEAGLWFYRARYYQPGVGRFATEDPLRFGGGLHFYDYVSASPLSARDPLGLFDLADMSGGTVEQLEMVSNFSNGFADVLSFGLMRVAQRGLGLDAQIDYCSTAYDLGEWTGVAWSTAFGGALGARAAGVKGAGREFSHWIPDRIVKLGPGWARKRVGRSALNGNYVTPFRHFRHDPFRYPMGWKGYGRRLNPVLRQLDRLPRTPLGASIGLGAGLASRAGQEESSCGCE